MAHTCGGCPERWTGLGIAHCGGRTGCHKTFGAVSRFDMHRKNGKCVSDAQMLKLGLIKNAVGVYTTPFASTAARDQIYTPGSGIAEATRRERRGIQDAGPDG